MTRHYAAFDIETATWVADDLEDWRQQRPLGISCAATCTADGNVVTWCGRTPAGTPADRMDRLTARELVSHLGELTRRGFTIVTWNGLGFDFDILAEESGLLDECR